jgi:thymidylate kinase
MKKQKLVIIEGSDGTGKSTQSKLLANKLEAELIIQPSKDNLVSFIRNEAKMNPIYSALERQLLIGISHTVDAFTLFDGERSLVMDRSYISGLVYGKRTGIEPYEMALLENILSSVYKANITHKYDVKIIFLNADNRLDIADNDVFESQINWAELSVEYTEIYRSLVNKKRCAFSENEVVTQIQVGGKTIDQIAMEIENFVNGNTAGK